VRPYILPGDGTRSGWNVTAAAVYLYMPQTYSGPVKLVRVFTDDLEYQIWVTAT
jgi:hypothetical protein